MLDLIREERDCTPKGTPGFFFLQCQPQRQELLFFFLAVLGLHFCARAFSSCGERVPLFIAVRGPLTVAASLVAEHRLQTHRLSSCGSRAQLLRGMWDLPRPGFKPVSPALAGRCSTTAPLGKPQGTPGFVSLVLAVTKEEYMRHLFHLCAM